jgi:TRAP-type mannitol/chloroaromatic compound transport system substrate-binding protein
MRIPGLGGAVITALGGTSVTLAGGEIFQALDSGTIDATEWVGPWNDLAFGFYKIAKYYYYPGFHEPGTVLSLGINREVWDSLSASDQTLFQAAAAAENVIDYSEFNANNSAALDTLINEHGVDFREFSDEIFEEVGKVALEVIAEVGATDGLTQRVHDSYMSFRSVAMGWSAIGEQAYMNKRALVK